jgi:hypothetical protein
LLYNKDQEHLKNSFIIASKQQLNISAKESNSSTFDDLFENKNKPENEKIQDQKSYLNFLQEMERDLQKRKEIKYSTTDFLKELNIVEKKDVKENKKKKKKNSLSEDNRALLEYTLGRKWLASNSKNKKFIIFVLRNQGLEV